jgi:hypothetical protein
LLFTGISILDFPEQSDCTSVRNLTQGREQAENCPELK